MTDLRLQGLTQWCRQQLADQQLCVQVVSGDASFRRYYRTTETGGMRYIAVDAPPETENTAAFIAIDQAFRSHGVLVPEVMFADLDNGYMLLEDFGDCLLLDQLSSSSVEKYYQQSLDSLLHLKDCTDISGYQLPVYDQSLLMTEMLLFPDWFINRHLGQKDVSTLIPNIDKIFNILIASAEEQPQVCVHRDYHSRNLMILDSSQIGIIDFQDAVLGPITYDLVSLLKDCYISWDRDRVLSWVESYYNRLHQQQLPGLGNLQQFIRWFDLMGMQRHLKVVGIFARLNYRDNKPDYLADIPRTLDYIRECCSIYPEFNELGHAIDNHILPLIYK